MNLKRLTAAMLSLALFLTVPVTAAIADAPEEIVQRIVIYYEDGDTFIKPGRVTVLRVGQSAHLKAKAYPESIKNPVIDWLIDEEETAVALVCNPDGTAVLTCLNADPGEFRLTVRCNGLCENVTVLLKEADENGFIEHETTAFMPEPLVNPVKLSEAGSDEIRKGDYVLFGSYEQDAILSDGPEPIEWLVLDVRDNAVLLLSRFVLEDIWYVKSFGYDESAKWEDSLLRVWMNTEFLSSALTEDESIMLGNPENDRKTETQTDNIPRDRAFLLTVSELEQYLPDEKDRCCQFSLYADSCLPRRNAYWFISVSKEDGLYLGEVDPLGRILQPTLRRGDSQDGVRPAVWVSLNKK